MSVLSRLLARAPRSLALAVFISLACMHTWPLASNPAHLSRIDNGDATLNAWAVSWVAHELPRRPWHVFDANIFYPETRTLAYSESMIVQGILAIPVIAFGGSAILAFSVVLISGLALTGWAFCLLIHRWTDSWSAAYIGGSLAAFNAHVLVRLVHLQTQHVEFIALVLLALDRLARSPRARDALWLGLGFALQGLTSVYLLVFTTWLLIFGTAARARDWWRAGPLRSLSFLSLAGLTSVVVMAPYLYAYGSLRLQSGFERTLVDNQMQAASWVDYLATGSRFHYDLWSHRFFDSAMSPTFPGVLAVLLFGVALSQRENRRDVRVQMCLAIAAGCAAVSMLPRTPIFPLAYAVIPLFRAVRVEAHLGQIVLLMIAVTAAFGVAGLERRVSRRRTWVAIAVALFALVNLEQLRAPLYYRPFDRVAPVYDLLATEPNAVVVEFPFYEPRGWFRNSTYMLNSTRHWRPMLNGYSGFRPGSYDDTFNAIEGFPDLQALSALHARGVTHVVVHEAEFVGRSGRERFDALADSPALVPMADEGDIHIYRLR